jgi:hypothetical protein
MCQVPEKKGEVSAKIGQWPSQKIFTKTTVS